MGGQEKKIAGSGFANKKTEETKVPSSIGQEIPSAAGALAKMEAAEVKVIHGACDGSFNVSGSKVSAVRASLVDAFNIPGDALAFVNGEQVDENHVLEQGQVLEFVKQAGVKGISEVVIL